MCQRFEGDFLSLGGIGTAEEGETTDCFEANAWVFVVHQLLQVCQRFFDAVVPEDQHAGGGGTGTGVFALKHFAQKLFVHNIQVLMQPETFQNVVLIGWIGFVEIGKPGWNRGGNILDIAAPKFGSGAIPNAVVGALEQIEKFFDRLAGNFLRLNERTIFVGDPINAAV
jgi:hypothetical protein